ncbi:signal peptide peptidase SppA [Aquabacterium sp. OR-4]|uniref:signal peptide peptidase SppA n=1 Tax=Aquabacterium sp. OR-4 TaxID=2978127 RepID=UPI0021B1FFDF|nr:signal peptide peptidase SppA [Aquabacterium sp. OR-4]MDT7834551.1 signal peptide peptidase SppA [Aquabacterium sp. OR-4]
MNPQDDAPPPEPAATPAPAAPAQDATPAPAAAASSAPAAAASAPASAASASSAGATAVPVVSLAALERTVDRLSSELLHDRRNERRWRIFFRLAWLMLVTAVAWALFAQRGSHSAPSTPHTALVELRGEIAADTEASAEQLIAGLRDAFADSGAQAVVLRINSPGGSPVQAGLINDEILRLKAKHKKKVYAVVEEICASGAYYVAVAADEIYVDKASLVGSIGVLMDGFGFPGLMDKLGVERRLITAGQNKAMMDPFSEADPKHRAYLQAMIDQIHQQFITVVKSGRGERLKATPDTFSGLVWNGDEAVKLGLVDHLGSLDYVAREVVKAEEIIDYTPRENVAERLAKRFGAAMGEGAVRAAGGVLRLR